MSSTRRLSYLGESRDPDLPRRSTPHVNPASQVQDHDLGCFDKSRCSLSRFELHFAGRSSRNDRYDLLVPNGKRYFGHEAADSDILDSPDKLVPPADATDQLLALWGRLRPGLEQKSINLALRDGMVPPGVFTLRILRA
jgi:hypothetical protein